MVLIGLLLGIVGVAQERRQPTRSGKVRGIVDIALSSAPLLCCVTSLLLALLMLTGAG